MTSGEWDLCALKALEKEEQKEFLALSQKNLFEVPLATGAPAVEIGCNTKRSLHPHLLMLPTIDEIQLIASKRQPAGSVVSSARLKLTRAFSLSAHSLSARAGGGGTGFSKKFKARLVGAKSSGSLSPSRHSHSYSVSPVYTPPPIRRCATLHHTQPVRKTFKTLHQLERQKRLNNAAATAQMQRILGTNKTYWKYGAHSTAASIIGQRTRLQQQLHLQHQLDSKQEPNISDELNPDAENHDSATETGSCSVPLPQADSNDLLRLSLMLCAASSAVTATAAGTDGPNRRSQSHSDIEDDVNDESVAHEAFYRPKSFERSLSRGSSLTVTAQESHSPSPSQNRAMTSTDAPRIFKSTSLDVPTRGSGVSTGMLEYEQQQQQIIVQQLSMMSMTTTTNQSTEHQTNDARYQHFKGDWEKALFSSAVTDDELEQHIKHCSCSCNHMGYGNSMDYQVHVN